MLREYFMRILLIIHDSKGTRQRPFNLVQSGEWEIGLLPIVRFKLLSQLVLFGVNLLMENLVTITISDHTAPETILRLISI